MSLINTTMYIEPKYNSGDRVAGGKLFLYTDNSQQKTLLPIWIYADLKYAEDGTGEAQNPLPIDINGINSSPIFYDQSQYPSAWYVVTDANNAVIRSGFVLPQSWQVEGETPIDPTNPWDSTLRGDLFWGYEVVTSVNDRGNIGRPVFYQPGTNGDRSGGLVLYFVPGAVYADNILTFAGAGGTWKAREEWINYSYLENALASVYGNGRREPFAFIQSNYAGQYNIRVDKVPLPPTQQSFTTNFTGLVKIDTGSRNSGVSPTNNFRIVVNLSNGNNLQLIKSNPFVYNGPNQTITFNVPNGSYSLSGMLANTSAGYANFIFGTLDALTVDLNYSNNIYLSNLIIRNLSSPLQMFNPNVFTGTNVTIEKTNLNSFVTSITPNVSNIQSLGLKKLVVDSTFTFNVDADLTFDTEASGGRITLTAVNGDTWYNANFGLHTNPPSPTGASRYKGFNIKPSVSQNVYSIDNKLYALNAEFYSCVTGFNFTPTVTRNDATQIDNNTFLNITGHNMIYLGPDVAGTIVMNNSYYSSKFYVNSPFVNINSSVYPSVYGCQIGEIQNIYFINVWFFYPGKSDYTVRSKWNILTTNIPHQFVANGTVPIINRGSLYTMYIKKAIKCNIWTNSLMDNFNLQMNSNVTMFDNMISRLCVCLFEDSELIDSSCILAGSTKFKNTKITRGTITRNHSGADEIVIDTGTKVYETNFNNLPQVFIYTGGILSNISSNGIAPWSIVKSDIWNDPAHSALRRMTIKDIELIDCINLKLNAYTSLLSSDFNLSNVTNTYKYTANNSEYTVFGNYIDYSIDNAPYAIDIAFENCQIKRCNNAFYNTSFIDSFRQKDNISFSGKIVMSGNGNSEVDPDFAYYDSSNYRCLSFYGEASAYQHPSGHAIWRPNTLTYLNYNFGQVSRLSNYFLSLAMRKSDEFQYSYLYQQQNISLNDFRNMSNWNNIIYNGTINTQADWNYLSNMMSGEMTPFPFVNSIATGNTYYNLPGTGSTAVYNFFGNYITGNNIKFNLLLLTFSGITGYINQPCVWVLRINNSSGLNSNMNNTVFCLFYDWEGVASNHGEPNKTRCANSTGRVFYAMGNYRKIRE